MDFFVKGNLLLQVNNDGVDVLEAFIILIKDCTSQMLIFIWRMQIVERTMENLFDSGIVPKSKVTSSR